MRDLSDDTGISPNQAAEYLGCGSAPQDVLNPYVADLSVIANLSQTSHHTQVLEQGGHGMLTQQVH